MTSPYANLDARAYWRTGVAERDPLDTSDFYRPKFGIDRSMSVVTAGSCFAQHVGRALKGAGFNVIDAEALPASIPDKVAHRFGYRLYSARYGNIYTARQLLQLDREAFDGFEPANPVWQKGDRFFDAQRPGLDPDGFATRKEVRAHRARHLSCVRAAYDQTDLFVFTFGLTEAWVHRETGTVYPTAPGTIAGTFDPDVYEFVNYRPDEVMADFEAFRERMLKRRPDAKFLITVSPVPLTATASGHHVEVATIFSKSVLRSAAGMLAGKYDDVDYFPSYEIITSQNNRGAYFGPNMRSVTQRGVDAAMSLVLKAHGIANEPATATADTKRRGKGGKSGPSADDLVCEEALLEAFAG